MASVQGGGHGDHGSGDYAIGAVGAPLNIQKGWARCKRCECLVRGANGPCEAALPHDLDSITHALVKDTPAMVADKGQAFWRFLLQLSHAGRRSLLPPSRRAGAARRDLLREGRRRRPQAQGQLQLHGADRVRRDGALLPLVQLPRLRRRHPARPRTRFTISRGPLTYAVATGTLRWRGRTSGRSAPNARSCSMAPQTASVRSPGAPMWPQA